MLSTEWSGASPSRSNHAARLRLMSEILNLALTRDEYLVIVGLTAEWRTLSRRKAMLYVKDRLDEFRRLPRTADSYD